jgi:hypothetical protein
VLKHNSKGHVRADKPEDFGEAIRVAKSRCKTDAEREALQRKIESGEPLHEILRELAPEHFSAQEF